LQIPANPLQVVSIKAKQIVTPDKLFSFKILFYNMFTAFFKGLTQLEDRASRQVLWTSIGLSILAFMVLWVVIATLLAETAVFDILWLEKVTDFLGGIATFIITILLFPAVTSAIIGLYLDRVAEAVENRDYPYLTPVAAKPFSETLLPTLRFLAIMVALNFVILLFLVIPPLFPFVFYGVNGYLIGREYFELVAIRRLDMAQVTKLRKKHGGSLYTLGTFAAFLLTIPVVNLLVPVVITATMVHLFEKWRQPLETGIKTVNTSGQAIEDNTA